jgi:broad specificity polyphosphatase/5'/3'-nucleotidase SurE
MRGVEEEGTDIGAMKNGFVSIMPLKLDLTDYINHQTLQAIGWER